MSNTKYIEISQGNKVFFDSIDLDLVSQYKWYTHKTRTGNAYAATKTIINGKIKTLLMHRLIMGVSDTKVDCDHIDSNGLNNTRANLRVCSRSENSMNRKPSKNGTSRYKGVSMAKNENKWRATIGVNGKSIYLGVFATEEEAAKAYNYAAKKRFGQFCRLNEL